MNISVAVVFIIAIASIIYFVNHWFISRKLKKEIWLPVVNNEGGVIGKLPYSLINQYPTQLIPIIRLIFKYKDKYYLKPCKKTCQFGQVDFPEEFLIFGETLDDCIKRQEKTIGLVAKYKARFKLKYKDRSCKDNHPLLTFLYTVEVETEDVFKLPYFEGGQMVTQKEIKRRIENGQFCGKASNDFEFLFLYEPAEKQSFSTVLG